MSGLLSIRVHRFVMREFIKVSQLKNPPSPLCKGENNWEAGELHSPLQRGPGGICPHCALRHGVLEFMNQWFNSPMIMFFLAERICK